MALSPLAITFWARLAVGTLYLSSWRLGHVRSRVVPRTLSSFRPFDLSRISGSPSGRRSSPAAKPSSGAAATRTHRPMYPVQRGRRQGAPGPSSWQDPLCRAGGTRPERRRGEYGGLSCRRQGVRLGPWRDRCGVHRAEMPGPERRRGGHGGTSGSLARVRGRKACEIPLIRVNAILALICS